jgi:hypothetical protein
MSDATKRPVMMHAKDYTQTYGRFIKAICTHEGCAWNKIEFFKQDVAFEHARINSHALDVTFEKTWRAHAT